MSERREFNICGVTYVMKGGALVKKIKDHKEDMHTSERFNHSTRYRILEKLNKELFDGKDKHKRH